MTNKVFWHRPYLTHLETTVRTVQGAQVTLHDTIFYAESGGQESDHGTIGGYPVEKAQLVDHEIFYTLPAGHTLQPGAPVAIAIDWPRRYRLMRLHFAAEVILELVYRIRPVEKTGAHIAAHKARIDFDWEGNISEIFAALTSRAADLVAADHSIINAFSDEENQRRYWEVEGFARVPCGGTHLKSTKEVGALRLKRKRLGQNKERIEIYLVDDFPGTQEA